MFVPGRPLQTVGELGNLCYSSWHTIRLYDHKWNVSATYPDPPRFHRVYDYFTLSTNAYEVKHGLINPNTTNVFVLASAFNQMPRREWITNGAALTWPNALVVAANVYQQATGSLLRISDLGNICWSNMGAGVYDSINNEIGYEAFMRNTAGLFSPGQNLFTIVSSGDAFYPANSQVAASQRAVAVVWRNPYPDANGHHECFIKMFKWITD